MLHMSAQCYEHRFVYCTNAKTCFNVHFRPILAEKRVLLGYALMAAPMFAWKIITFCSSSFFYFLHRCTPPLGGH